MGNWTQTLYVLLAAGLLIGLIDKILVPNNLECNKLDLVPVTLRSLVLLGSVLILQPETRSHIFLTFSFAMAFDYFYTRMFKS